MRLLLATYSALFFAALRVMPSVALATLSIARFLFLRTSTSSKRSAKPSIATSNSPLVALVNISFENLKFVATGVFGDVAPSKSPNIS